MLEPEDWFELELRESDNETRVTDRLSQELEELSTEIKELGNGWKLKLNF